MGDEAFRSDDEPVSAEEAATIRRFRYEAPVCECAISAPDGRRVAAVSLSEVNDVIELTKGKPLDISLGQVQIALLVTNIAQGSSFVAVPVKLAQSLKIGGISPKSWEFTVTARFDGSAMVVEILQLSTGLRNANLLTGMEGLADNEELTLTIPKETIRTSVSVAHPRISAPIIGRLCLRARR
jgi:hypothetical protein